MSAQPTFEAWLKRKPRPPRPKKPLPKRSKKREIEDRIYAKKRKAFLRAHPYCEAVQSIRNWLFSKGLPYPYWIPRATQIHHLKKPRCKHLNDESTWLAVSNWSHRWIHDHPKEARALGLLLQ